MSTGTMEAPTAPPMTLGLTAVQLSKFNETLQVTLKSLIAVVSREIEAIDSGRQDLLKEFAAKKMQLLTQLESLSRVSSKANVSEENLSETRRLKDTLSLNMKKLELRIKAIRELTTTIEEAVREEESDGTYEAHNRFNEF